MYIRTTSLSSLNIRNIIADDMGIPSLAPLAYRGGAILNFAFTEFSEVSGHFLPEALRPSPRLVRWLP